MDPREHRQVIDRIDAGRRAATVLLQRLDLGLDPAAVIREIAPTLPDLAVQAAADLAQLALFDHAALGLLLSGLVPTEVLAGLEIPPAPARQARRTPDEIAADWLLGDLAASLSVATESTPDMSPAANPSLGLEPPVTGPEGHSG